MTCRLPDVVEIKTRCRIPIWRTFGWIQWDVIPEPPATLQGATTWRIQCHDSRATCHIAGVATGRIQWLVIPEPRITLQGAATWWIHCHDSRATRHIAGCSHLVKSVSWSCHIAGCKNSIRHIENRFSPYLIFFCFSCSLGFDERRLSYRLGYTCFLTLFWHIMLMRNIPTLTMLTLTVKCYKPKSSNQCINLLATVTLVWGHPWCEWTSKKRRDIGRKSWFFILQLR